MPKVLNKRTDTISPDAVYVGRPSKWGNPYKFSPHKNKEHWIKEDTRDTEERGRVILEFREYALRRLVSDPTWLGELRGKDLVCWCAPLPCHADVLLELANK